MLLLTNTDVEAVLDIAESISALRVAYADLARGDAIYGPRIDYFLPTGRANDYHQWGNMVGGSVSSGVVAVRMKSDVVSWPNGRSQDKYCARPGLYCGLVLLFSVTDGAPIALIHDGYLQHLRVGAAAALGAERLANPRPKTIGLLGSGGMARSFLEAFTSLFPLVSARVYSPTASHRDTFAREMSERTGITVTAVSDPEAAVTGADLVASATNALGPTFDPSWLRPGAHVTCVTRRELGDELLARSDLTCQLGVHTIPHSAAVPMLEWTAGGIASYIAGTSEDRARIPRSRPASNAEHATLLEVQTGVAPGRTSTEQITLFVVTGTQGLQFAAVAGRAFVLATQRGIGRNLPDEWFLQDIRD